MKRIKVTSFGPIQEGEVEFGDLTVLVGPQASGKSLLVQLFKAIEDTASIKKTLHAYGYDWLHGRRAFEGFLSLYFGGGMESVWQADTAVTVDGRRCDFPNHVVSSAEGGSIPTDSVFLVPAQRALVLEDGWPKSFESHSDGAPFCLRTFSELVRRAMMLYQGRGKGVFPQLGRLNSELRRLMDGGIYIGGKVKLRTDGMRKRIVLEPYEGGPALPYSAWSAGQREFTPLLIMLCWLIPSANAKPDRPEIVVIEEPEMGLHPQAIMSFCLLVLELLHRGYKVIVSTHSPVVLDVVWALRELADLEEGTAIKALKQIFGIRRLDPQTRKVLASSLKKSYRTFYFGRTEQGVRIQDISTLDPGSDDDDISGWGGLSGFSGGIADVIGRTICGGGAG